MAAGANEGPKVREAARTAFLALTAVLLAPSCMGSQEPDYFAEGDAAYIRKDYGEAARLLRLAADKGDVRAQYNLGYMYERGEGVPKSDVESVRWYALAAAQGDAMAQSNLGIKYANGEGVAQNDVEAVRLYRLASEHGNVPAHTNLGYAFAEGNRPVPGKTTTARSSPPRPARDGSNCRADDSSRPLPLQRQPA